MLISTAPVAIPVNTANLAIESVVSEASQRPQIPQPAATAKNPSTRNPTEFSEQAKNQFRLQSQTANDPEISDKKNESQEESQQEQDSTTQQTNSRTNQELDAEEIQQVAQLRQRDSEVRAHEQAHASVGGNLAGAPNLSFTTGPDGKRYATSGEVAIDVSPIPNDPAASIRKFDLVQRAALAPANPSSQDRKVAAQAASASVQARSDLNLERLQEKQQLEKGAKTERSNEAGSSSRTDKLQSDPSQASTIDTSPTKLNLSAPSELLDNINPVRARRQSAQLNQRIASSGALFSENIGQRVSISA